MVEFEFYVVGVFEFFEDDVVYVIVGFDEGCGDNCQVVFFFDVLCSAEELFGLLHGIRVEIICEDPVVVGDNHVIGMGETCDVVEEDDDILLVFDQLFGFFDYHVGYLDVVCWRFVECRVDDFFID